MNKKHSLSLLPIFITLSLLAVFILTTPVFAQDETPPTEPVPEEAPVEEVEPAPLAETLSDAGVEVVDESGEAIPLALEMLNAVDPYFKVGTVNYSFTLADCNPDLAGDQPCDQPLQAAINYISAHSTIPSDGFIHVDMGELPDQKVNIDGSDSNLAKLKGIVGHVDPNTFTPDAKLTYTDGDSGSYIYVHDKPNGFTLSSLFIGGASFNRDYSSGVVEFGDCSGSLLLQDLVVRDDFSSGNGISIQNHNGRVTLTNVDSSGIVGGGGAYIDTADWIAGVTVTNSSFDENDGYDPLSTNGLHIVTKGAVNITAVTASRNTGSYEGLLVRNASSVTIKKSVIKDNANGYGLMIYNLTGAGNITLQNVYVDQNRYGMYLRTPGNISLTDVSASKNQGIGAQLDTCHESIGACTYLGTGKVTITGGTFNENPGNGGETSALLISARGAISLTNVSATGNGTINAMGGAFLDTHYSQLVSPVTITNGTFNSNNASLYRNLVVLSKGAITLTSVQASENPDGAGALLDNTYGTTAGVTLKGSTSARNKFNINLNGSGLEVLTKGAISLSYVEAMLNDGMGVDLDNSGGTGNVTFLQGIMSSNNESNLNIVTHGAITLTSIFSDTSQTGRGISLDNSGASTPKPVSFTHGTASYNDLTGVFIWARGAVTITDVSASGNTGGDGIRIDNAYLAGLSVTFKDCSFKDNIMYGLYLTSQGAVKLTNVNATGNYSDGIFISNGIAPQPVTINGMTASSNFGSGLILWTDGAVNLSNITAESNHNNGIMLGDAIFGHTPKSVTINHAEINWNGWTVGGYDNLRILSSSFVTLSYVSAAGCDLSNCSGAVLGNPGLGISIPGAVTISHSDFGENRMYGLWVSTKGKITLSYVTANENGLYGAWLDNTPGAPLYPTTSISNSEFNSNIGSYGLQLTSRGGVSLTNIKASGNLNGYGAYIHNESGNVSLLTTGANFNQFNNNGLRGLDLDTAGAVILNNVAANNNTYGVFVYNSTGSPGNVTVKGGIYNGNSYGLYIPNSIGVITVNGMTASYNTNTGAFLNNTDDHSGLKGVTINKSVFDKNARGLQVQSWGQITLNNVSASNSTTGKGAELNNAYNTLPAPKGISVLGTLGANNFNSNTLDGLFISSKGAVTVTKVTANNNAGYGIWVDNYSSAVMGAVTLSYLTVNGNGAIGIFINSNNAVTLSNSTVMFTKNNNIGIYVQTHNHKLTVSNSLITVNGNTGLRAIMGGPTTLFKMTGTYYFGNCTGAGIYNVYVTS